MSGDHWGALMDADISRSRRVICVQVLMPTLSPGDAVIMDNPGSHKGADVRTAIAAASASLLSLPPCSPDFNPIENAFAKLKTVLRRVAERTVVGLWTTIGRLLAAITLAECTNFLAIAGHDPAGSETTLIRMVEGWTGTSMCGVAAPAGAEPASMARVSGS